MKPSLPSWTQCKILKPFALLAHLMQGYTGQSHMLTPFLNCKKYVLETLHWCGTNHCLWPLYEAGHNEQTFTIAKCQMRYSSCHMKDFQPLGMGINQIQKHLSSNRGELGNKCRGCQSAVGGSPHDCWHNSYSFVMSWICESKPGAGHQKNKQTKLFILATTSHV